jgi:hypothetical protein
MRAEVCLKYSDGSLSGRQPCHFSIVIKDLGGTCEFWVTGFTLKAKDYSDRLVILDEGDIVGELLLKNLSGITSIRKGDTITCPQRNTL